MTTGPYFWFYLNISLPSQYAIPEERDDSFEVFMKMFPDIDILNAAEKAEDVMAVFCITVMSYMSKPELESQCLGTVPPQELPGDPIEIAEVPAYQGPATSVDWTGILTTPIKNQGQCGLGLRANHLALMSTHQPDIKAAIDADDLRNISSYLFMC